MPGVPLISLDDLEAARDKAYANAAEPGLSEAEADAWEARGDRLEIRRQKLASKEIDDGSQVFRDNAAVMQAAATNLDKVNNTLTAAAANLKAFDDLINSLTKLVTTVLPLIA
jgi:hypothetical protein